MSDRDKTVERILGFIDTSYYPSAETVVRLILDEQDVDTQAREDALIEAEALVRKRVGGFTVMIRCPGDDPYEGQEIACLDDEGPWVLNSATADAIKALREGGA